MAHIGQEKHELTASIFGFLLVVSAGVFIFFYKEDSGSAGAGAAVVPSAQNDTTDCHYIALNPGFVTKYKIPEFTQTGSIFAESKWIQVDERCSSVHIEVEPRQGFFVIPFSGQPEEVKSDPGPSFTCIQASLKQKFRLMPKVASQQAVVWLDP